MPMSLEPMTALLLRAQREPVAWAATSRNDMRPLGKSGIRMCHLGLRENGELHLALLTPRTLGKVVRASWRLVINSAIA